MKISIIEECRTKEVIHEYRNVPKEVANAVVRLLDECLDYIKGLAENTESKICSAESEGEEV